MGRKKTNLMDAKEAAKYLRVSLFTLDKMEQEGEEALEPYRTPGGHRRYSVKMLNKYFNKKRR